MNIVILPLFYLPICLSFYSTHEEMVVIMNKFSLLYFKVERSVAQLIRSK